MVLEELELQKIRHKFYICYFLAKKRNASRSFVLYVSWHLYKVDIGSLGIEQLHLQAIYSH